MLPARTVAQYYTYSLSLSLALFLSLSLYDCTSRLSLLLRLLLRVRQSEWVCGCVFLSLQRVFMSRASIFPMRAHTVFSFHTNPTPV